MIRTLELLVFLALCLLVCLGPLFFAFEYESESLKLAGGLWSLTSLFVVVFGFLLGDA